MSERPAFHNPYNFVPLGTRPEGGPLADAPPAGHHRYHKERHHGTIRVKLTTETPLLIPDAARARRLDNDHVVLPPRRDARGAPFLPPTSIRGPLRAAYEAVTRSRLGVFAGHEHPLRRRMATKEGLALVPCRIEQQRDGELVARLMPGTSDMTDSGPGDSLAYAAWLETYEKGSGKPADPDHPVYRPPLIDGPPPENRQEVWGWIEKYRHHAWSRRRNEWESRFTFWRVQELAYSNDALFGKPDPTPKPERERGRNYHEPLGQLKRVRGWVCLSNKNINGKHAERVFFEEIDDEGRPRGKRPAPVAIDETIRKRWKTLIKDYRELHEQEIRDRRPERPDAYLGHEPGKTAFSRHVYEPEYRDLHDGLLCYAKVKRAGGRWALEDLYPVMLSRCFFETAPVELLPADRKPARDHDALSPADRVFGWVRQGGKRHARVAHAAALRITRSACHASGEEALEELGPPDGDGLPLAILSSGKPQQARFYASGDATSGRPAGGDPKNFYKPGGGLRGTKVFPHHRHLSGLTDYWTPEAARRDLSQESVGGRYYREYRRPRGPRGERDSQNRSVTHWVKPGVEFSFEVGFRNLHAAELGALLWLLDLNRDLAADDLPRFLRIGAAKPLGFGSVRVKVERLNVRDGSAIAAAYGSLRVARPWSRDDAGTASDPAPFVDAFRRALVGAAPDAPEEGIAERFESDPSIRAFLRASTGFDDGLPVHYPRAKEPGQTDPVPPNPDGEMYKWFVTNGSRHGPKLPLPLLVEDAGLPALEDTKGGGHGGGRGRGGPRGGPGGDRRHGRGGRRRRRRRG